MSKYLFGRGQNKRIFVEKSCRIRSGKRKTERFCKFLSHGVEKSSRREPFVASCRKRCNERMFCRSVSKAEELEAFQQSKSLSNGVESGTRRGISVEPCRNRHYKGKICRKMSKGQTELLLSLRPRAISFSRPTIWQAALPWRSCRTPAFPVFSAAPYILPHHACRRPHFACAP